MIRSPMPALPVNMTTATAVKTVVRWMLKSRKPPLRNCCDARANAAEPYRMTPVLGTNVGLVTGIACVGAGARVASDANSWFLLGSRAAARASGAWDSAGVDCPAAHGAAKASLKRVLTSPEERTRL